MKYDAILNAKITQNVDEQYRKLHTQVVPGVTVNGVRVPMLRKIAREFAVYDDFLGNITLDSYEVICVACYYIGYTTKGIALLQQRLDMILPYINNWAVCDTFVSSLKILKTKSRGEFYPVVIHYLQSENDFTVRFAIVCLLSYYLSADKINEILTHMVQLQERNYYIDMAIAWLVSVAFVKCREQTLAMLASQTLTPFVQNKSISKICDSFRVSVTDKKLVKQYRI